jgi:hypothetical protein
MNREAWVNRDRFPMLLLSLFAVTLNLFGSITPVHAETVYGCQTPSSWKSSGKLQHNIAQARELAAHPDSIGPLEAQVSQWIEKARQKHDAKAEAVNTEGLAFLVPSLAVLPAPRLPPPSRRRQRKRRRLARAASFSTARPCSLASRGLLTGRMARVRNSSPSYDSRIRAMRSSCLTSNVQAIGLRCHANPARNARTSATCGR